GASLDTEDLYVVLYPYMLKLLKGVPYVEEEKGEEKYILLFHSYEDAKKYMITNDFKDYNGCYLIGRFDPSDKYANLRNTFKSFSKMGVTHYMIDEKGLGSIADYLEKCGEEESSNFSTYDQFAEDGSGTADFVDKLGLEGLKQMMQAAPAGLPIIDFTYPFEISQEREVELFNQFRKIKSFDELYDKISGNKYYENCHVMASLELKLMMGVLPEEMASLLPVYSAAVWQSIVTDQARLFLLKNKMEDGYMTKELPNSDKKLIYVAFTDIHSHQFPWIEFQEIEMVDLSTILEEDSSLVGVTFCDMAGMEANLNKPGWLSE
ncbi:MAG: hypothetical protein J6Y37_00685, partial [Paludibacteraceae bacterium]|nr:hypothetical protein [Paludibacteraceae bacterium]